MILYSIFHLNLMFSSIAENDRKKVIDKCYWPLLELCENDFKIGIELTGNTLEIISNIDNNWIIKLKQLINSNKIELVGSGYSQIIGPLVPAKVNNWNQKLGVEVYEKILKTRPTTALVNEMSYSSGLIEHYISNGYKTIIMEINNSFKLNNEWISKRPKYIKNQKGQVIEILWSDSIAFQKFQRHIHGENNLSDYLNYIKNYKSEIIPIYTSDAEIFDYRPGRFHEEANLTSNISEWEKIKNLYLELENLYTFQLPREINSFNKNNSIISIETSETPIVVKKQYKYNINRWALTGKNDLYLNTLCYKFYKNIQESSNKDLWRKLCYFWSSDFRTHINEERWCKLQTDLENFSLILEINEKIESIPFERTSTIDIINSQRYLNLKNGFFEINIDSLKGNSFDSVKKTKNKKALFGKIDHGYFYDIEYGFDYFSGHCIIERPGKRKLTDLSAIISKTSTKSEIHSECNLDGYKIQSITKLHGDELILNKQITCESREIATIHPFNFTFIPESWDKKSLYFASHNGGNELEIFELNNNLNHQTKYSYLISSIHGIGNTEGIIIIGDKNKSIEFKISQTKSQAIPYIFFNKVDDSYLLRLTYSIQEIDETFRESESKQNIDVKLSIKIID